MNAAPPPPPPPPPPKVTANFAASAAMAKDILALGLDGEETAAPPPPPPPPAQHAPLAAVADVTQPRAVPDLDQLPGSTERSEPAPMAPDFFFSSSKHKSARLKSARHTSSRNGSKTKLFKITR